MTSVFTCPECGADIQLNKLQGECNYCGSELEVLLNELNEVEDIIIGYTQEM